ncbi:MAG: hypothetical protein OHK0029_04140 [Armatimonadaceae bacterium]
MTGQSVRVAFVDQGYTGENPQEAAQEKGMCLQVVKHQEAKKGFVVLPKRCRKSKDFLGVVERSIAWTARFRRLARDYERLPETLAGLHFVVFAGLMLVRASAKGLLIPHFQAITT